MTNKVVIGDKFRRVSPFASNTTVVCEVIGIHNGGDKIRGVFTNSDGSEPTIEFYPTIHLLLPEYGWERIINQEVGKHIDRYDLDFHGSHGEDAYMRKDPEGEYVLFSDVEELLNQMAGVADAAWNGRNDLENKYRDLKDGMLRLASKHDDR